MTSSSTIPTDAPAHQNGRAGQGLAAAAKRADDDFDAAIAELSGYLRHAAISCEPARRPDIEALANQLAIDLAALGLRRARVLQLADALPIVAAEWLDAGADAPTVLVYGHMDLQPVAGEAWTSPPHEPTIRGDRLYARGAADDMGGWVSHLAAVRAWFDTAGALPCNLKFIIEAEEEIGSPNLERYMDAYPDVFAADVMILTDCENPSTTVPGLTVSLRGLIEVELTVASADADVHSGLWGGVVPDPALGLMQIIASLVDADGRMLVARRHIPPAVVAAASQVPFDAEVARRGAHLRPDVPLLPPRAYAPPIWMWHQPALTVLSTTLPAPGKEKNAIRHRASARLSVRLAPEQHADDVVELLAQAVTAARPAGMEVNLRKVATFGQGWSYQPAGPAFAAVARAYQASWGCAPAQVGVGGSIPFVALFARRFASLPLILNGVMDPESTAHGPNESLHLGVFRCAILANVHLYDELGRLGRAGLQASDEVNAGGPGGSPGANERVNPGHASAG